MKFSYIITSIVVVALTVAIINQAQAWRCHRYHSCGVWDRYGWCQGDAFCAYPHCRVPGCVGYCGPYRTNVYTVQDGWDLVRKNQPHKALEMFEKISEAASSVGKPELGIAVAAADAGKLPHSVAAMRRLLQFAPGVMQLFDPDPDLAGKLAELVKLYQGQSHGLPRQDAFFMQACLYYLIRDKQACLTAVRLCRDTGDVSDSALNLYFMAENDQFRWSAGGS